VVQIEAKFSQLLNQAQSFEVTPDQLTALIRAAFRRAFAQTFHLPEETLTVRVEGDVVIVRHYSEELTIATPDRALVTAVRRLVIQGVQEIRASELYHRLKPFEGQLVEAVVLDNPNTIKIEGRGEEMRGICTLLPHAAQLPGETYAPGQRIQVYLEMLDCFSRDGFLRPTGWSWLASRTSPGLVRELFRLHLPEIEVLDVARQAGTLSKVTVAQSWPYQVLKPLLRDLPSQEKVSLVQWSEVTQVYIANALSPARVNPQEVKLLDGGVALVRLNPDQMGKAYGRGWVNLKLAQQLTGWKIELVAFRAVCNV